MLMKTFKKRKLEITANASYMSAPIEAKHFPKPIDFTINNVEYHLASYVDYTSPTANLVHEPVLLNGATEHSVVEGAVYTFYGESVLVEPSEGESFAPYYRHKGKKNEGEIDTSIVPLGNYYIEIED